MKRLHHEVIKLLKKEMIQMNLQNRKQLTNLDNFMAAVTICSDLGTKHF